MSEELKVELREITGKRRNKRMRNNEGKVPAILYGHGGENIMLTVPAKELGMIIRRGERVIKLTGAVNEQVLIKEVQWNTWGAAVYHVDFTRVSANEKVNVVVPLKLHGDCPGAQAGGVVTQNIHEIHIECPAIEIPEFIQVKIDDLQLNGHITVGQIVFPKDVRALIDADEIVVHCAQPKAEAEPAAAEGAEGSAEPEVIGRKKEEETEEKK